MNLPIKPIPVRTPNGPGRVEAIVDGRQGPLLLVRHRSGATWLYFPGEIETLTAAATALLDARLAS